MRIHAARSLSFCSHAIALVLPPLPPSLLPPSSLQEALPNTPAMLSMLEVVTNCDLAVKAQEKAYKTLSISLVSPTSSVSTRRTGN